MNKLEHANIVVTAIEPTLKFLKIVFPDWRVRGQGGGDWHGKPRTWLHFGDDESYIAMSDNGEGAHRDLSGHQSGLAHLAFEVDDVDGVIERLGQNGHQPSQWGPEHPHRKNVYFVDPDGLEFEFVEYFSQVPTEKNRYD